jgi:hypothetical protein
VVRSSRSSKEMELSAGGGGADLMHRGFSMQGVTVWGSIMSPLCIINHWAARVVEIGQHQGGVWDG